ncbi:MAG: acetate kinase [Desulfobacterales bacterium]|nr:acetate kinase [Desulfobacterales bacterium]
MKVFVVNAGSSSLKYQLLDMRTETVLATGLVERIGEAIGRVTHKRFPDTEAEEKTVFDEAVTDHKMAMHRVIDLITAPDTGVIAEKAEIDAIGHRVVQGGEVFNRSIIIDTAVKEAVRANNPLAPLHNPANLVGIEVAEALFNGTPNVAVFDTEFHQTMPARAFLYALPYRYYKELRIRRYGYHGTSHKYVAGQAARLMDRKPESTNLITVHLGNGCSMAAVAGGRCMDTSMGMTPLAGLMMGTRSGDIDPAIIAYIAHQQGLGVREIDDLLNKESGLKGICGANDMRDIHARADRGDDMARQALEMFAYRVKKYIGAYVAVLGRVDAVVFTAGIGENDDVIRAMICQDLDGLGIRLDEEKNRTRGGARPIHAADSRVALWVIPTNEELQIARDTVTAVSTSAPTG